MNAIHNLTFSAEEEKEERFEYFIDRYSELVFEQMATSNEINIGLLYVKFWKVRPEEKGKMKEKEEEKKKVEE